MAAGVTIVDPANTYIDPDVEVGPDTVIHPGVVIQGHSKIGGACEIHGYVRITDSELADKVTINNFCVLVGARVADGATIGPFAHLRPASDVGPGAKVGNFVELKKTTLGQVEGQPPDVSRRCDDRRARQYRGRDHHLQLRRSEEASNGHRRWSLHRQRHATDRAGTRRKGRLRGRRILDYRGRSGRRDGHRCGRQSNGSGVHSRSNLLRNSAAVQ